MSETRTISASYHFFDEQGTLIDSSEQSGPMTFQTGQNSVLPAIETALKDAAICQEIELELAPEQAYGEHRPELVFEAIHENLPQDVELRPGMELYSGSGDRSPFRLRVVRLTENGALLDGNHPLAGKTLKVQLTVLDTQPS